MPLSPGQTDKNLMPMRLFSSNGSTQMMYADPVGTVFSVGPTILPPGFIDSNIPFYVVGSTNSYFGINLYNLSAGGTASTDIVVGNSAGGTTSSGTYTDFGIVGTGNTDANYAVFDASAGYLYSQSNNFYLGCGTPGTLHLFAGGFASKAKVAVAIDPNQNIAMGTGAIGSAATNGFLYIRSGAGAPTGTPTAKSGLVPMYYDTTNNNFYIYATTWKKASTGGTWA